MTPPLAASRTATGPLRPDLRVLLALACALALSACRSSPARRPVPLPPPPPSAPAPSAPAPQAPPAAHVRPAAEPLTIAAWAEPSHLPPGGGQAHLLVRVLRHNGRPYPGVDVQLRATRGSLYSQGRVLTTDNNGMTRDRLTTRRTATVTVDAGGTEYVFHVPVLPREAGAE